MHFKFSTDRLGPVDHVQNQLLETNFNAAIVEKPRHSVTTGYLIGFVTRKWTALDSIDCIVFRIFRYLTFLLLVFIGRDIRLDYSSAGEINSLSDDGVEPNCAPLGYMIIFQHDRSGRSFRRPEYVCKHYSLI